MKLARFPAAAAALLLVSGCTQFGVFEDVGSDPHPPVIRVTGLVILVPGKAAAVAPDPAATRVIAWDSGGFTIRQGEKFQIAREYEDAGADLVRFHVRDRDGSLRTTIDPAGEQEFYTGTSGSVLGPESGLEIMGPRGPHRIEVWGEDSHESRSEKVEFVITLVP